jgi:hypothetical protein
MSTPGRRARVSRAAAGLLVLAAALLPSSGADSQVAPTASRWWDEVARVRNLLDDGKWQKAARRAEAVREELVGSSWREPDLGVVLAELAFQAAVARAGLGEDAAALWEWHSALNLERLGGRSELAGRDLSRYGRAAGLLAGHPLRAEGEIPPGHSPANPRPDRDWEPPGPREGFVLEPLENSGAAREWPDPAVFELLIDRDGALLYPVLASSWSHPVVVQWALDNLRRASPFRPARMEGQPVEVLWLVELDLNEVLGGYSGRR